MKKKLYKIAVQTKLIYIWRGMKFLGRKVISIVQGVKNHGLLGSIKLIIYRISQTTLIQSIKTSSLDRKLDMILKNNNTETIILALSSVDWNIPLFQRPQHLAIQVANQGCLYFYHTQNHYDHIDGYKNLGKNLYLTNRFDDVYNKLKGTKKYILVSNNMCEGDDLYIEDAVKHGDKIIYDYLDEISSELSGREIPEFILRTHERLLKDEENCYVVATATKLYEDVAKHRNKNFRLVPNGVVYEHFRNIKKTIPKEMKEVVDEQKPIIGYYGALAGWFDYEMIKDAAREREDWNFVLMGWDYDSSLDKSGMEDIDNIHIIGPKDYKILPLYAQWFDACTIPFKINEITLATSPVKLFEYMALGKPIVTTPIPECKKYKSVLISENNSKDFVEKVEKALDKKNDEEYIKILEKEGKDNTWDKRAKDIIDLIR